MDKLTSTEKTSIDLIALRAFHWKASMDPDREPVMRRWHRGQVKHISVRLSVRDGGRLTADTHALIEMMVDENAEATYHEVGKVFAGDWQKLCELSRSAILKKMRGHPPFDKLV